MAEYSRDADDLRESLTGHRVSGYRVAVPLFGSGTLMSSTRTLDKTFFRVKASRPKSFAEVASELKWDDAKKSLAEWTKDVPTELPGQLRTPIKILPPEIWERLESGERVSWRDIMKVWLDRGGCLDRRDRVTCFDFSAADVLVPAGEVYPGMFLEFEDQGIAPAGYNTKRQGWAGRVAAVKRGSHGEIVVLHELIEPVPFLSTPEAIDLDEIRPGFYSSRSWVLGGDLYSLLEKEKQPIPPGQFSPEDREKRLYYLDESIPLADVEAFSKAHPMFHPLAWYQAMTMFVLPIHPMPVSGVHLGGFFRPLPEQTGMLTLEEEREQL